MSSGLERLAYAGVVPVVVLNDAKDAVPAAKALYAGGIDVMEITFRTKAAPDAIKEVSMHVPEMLVGAGTVVTLEQCRLAVECGAKFIVSPGYDEDIVSWCVEQNILVLPGCVTPTEIMAALKHDLKVLKFFPANIYGGLAALKALCAPFGNVKFIPTGGINEKNVGEYIASPYVHAVGGSWICTKEDIAAGNFERITALCKQARDAVMGFELAHVGINSDDIEAAAKISEAFHDILNFPIKEGTGSYFVSSGIEVCKKKFLGEHGHIAVRTNSVAAAIAEFARHGYQVRSETVRSQGDRLTLAYLCDEPGGFAIHLIQK